MPIPRLARCLAVPGALAALLATGCLTEEPSIPLTPPEGPPSSSNSTEDPPEDSVTIDELTDVSPPGAGHGDSHLVISSHLQIPEGVRIKVDGRYLIERPPEGRATYLNLNAYDAGLDFGMAMRLPPGFTKVELVTVDGEVVATHIAPPRTAIDDHVQPHFLVWGEPDAVQSKSWFAQATDGDPTTLEHTLENALSTPITLLTCERTVCVPFAEVTPGATYKGSFPIPPAGDATSVTYQLEGQSWSGFQVFATTPCQFEHAFVYDGAYGPGRWEGLTVRASGCVGR